MPTCFAATPGSVSRRFDPVSRFWRPPIDEGGKSYELQVVGGSFAQDGIYMYFPQTDRLATCGRLTFQPLALGSSK